MMCVRFMAVLLKKRSEGEKTEQIVGNKEITLLLILLRNEGNVFSYLRDYYEPKAML